MSETGEGGESIPVQANNVDKSDTKLQTLHPKPQPVASITQQKPALHPVTKKTYGSDIALESPKKFDDPKQQKRQDARAFSKSTPEGREARLKTAAEIVKLRQVRNAVTAEQGEEDRNLGQRGENLSTEINQTEASAAELQMQIDKINSEISKIEGNFLRRRLSGDRVDQLRDQIPAIQGQIEGKQIHLAAVRDDLIRNQRNIDRNAERPNPNERLRKDVKRILGGFYIGQNDKITEIRERDELEHYKDEEGHVENLAQLDLYVVHGTKPGLIEWASDFSGDWQDKIATIVDLKPTLSTSTIKRGERARLWSPLGVIFRSGRVEDASPSDLGTGGGSLKERTGSHIGSRSITRFQDSINPLSSTYNELILGDDPEVAGLFISLDERMGMIYDGENSIGMSYGGGSKILNFGDIFVEAGRYGMKIFVIKNGVAYESSLDESGRLVLGDEVSPQQMINQTYEIPEENRQGIHDQAVNSFPPGFLQVAA